MQDLISESDVLIVLNPSRCPGGPAETGFRYEVDCFGMFQDETSEPETDEVWDKLIDIIHSSTGSHNDIQSCCADSKCHFYPKVLDRT